MSDSKGNPLLKAVGTLATQKEELATKEMELVDSLNSALKRMGYRVVPRAGGILTDKRRGTRPGSRSGATASVSQARRPRKRGRRGMSAAERSAVSRRMKAYWSKRRKAARRAKESKGPVKSTS